MNAIVEDELGIVWLGTKKGLSGLRTTTQKDCDVVADAQFFLSYDLDCDGDISDPELLEYIDDWEEETEGAPSDTDLLEALRIWTGQKQEF